MRHLPTLGHAFRASQSTGLWPCLVYGALMASISVILPEANEQAGGETHRLNCHHLSLLWIQYAEDHDLSLTLDSDVSTAVLAASRCQFQFLKSGNLNAVVTCREHDWESPEELPCREIVACQ